MEVNATAMKSWKLAFALILPILFSNPLAAQRSFGIGTSFSYDYGLNFPEGTKYEPYGKGETGAFSFDAYVRIPLGGISITPAYIYSIPSRTMLISNPDGDYIPEGYLVDLPYDPQNPDVYVSQPYPDLSAEAEIWQQTYGAFITLNMGPNVGLGSGVFMRRRNVRIFERWGIDEYYWIGSNASVDTYSYWDTYHYYPDYTEYTYRDLTFPLLLNIEWNWGSLANGTSFIWWLGGGGDRYVSFRYSMGISF